MERKGNPESHPGVLQEKNKGRCWMQDFFIARAGKAPLHQDTGGKDRQVVPQESCSLSPGAGRSQGMVEPHNSPHWGRRDQTKREGKKRRISRGVHAPWSEVNSDAVPLPQELR